jgi:hypothetical protein
MEFEGALRQTGAVFRNLTDLIDSGINHTVLKSNGIILLVRYTVKL